MFSPQELEIEHFWKRHLDSTPSFVLKAGIVIRVHAYVGTLDGLYQHTLIATGTRLRPVKATFSGHILGTKHAEHMWV